MAFGRRSTFALALTGFAALFARKTVAQSTPGTGAGAASGVEPSEALPVGFAADQMRLDTRTQALDVAGNVRVEQAPFYLTSDALQLRRVPIGVRLDGEGRLGFCPCLGSPLAVRFSGATVAPPYDVIVKDPVLEVVGVPVAWAPAFWLRSPARPGLLAPDLAWRGEDGFFAGGGVHVPWRGGDAVRGLDLRAGGYVDGGFAVGATLRTGEGTSDVRWDKLHGDDGVAVDSRGSTAAPSAEASPSVAWSVEALRGSRALKATSDVDAAARPFDRAVAQASWAASGWTIASGVRTTALRGGELSDVGVGGPVVLVHKADALGSTGSYAATLEGGQLWGGGASAADSGSAATSFVRGDAGALLATRAGAVGASLEVTGVGDAADDGFRGGLEGAAQLRGAVRLPMVRAFESQDGSDPWVHRTEPRWEGAAVATHTDDAFVRPAGRGAEMPDGTGWVLEGGWDNTLGRWGSRAAADIDLAGGAVAHGRTASPALRGHAAASAPWASLDADVARLFATGSAPGGGALFVRTRVGRALGLHATVHVAQRDGVDPLLARMLVSAPLEPAGGFLAVPGWTGGVRLGVPIGVRVTARGGADYDLDARELVAAVGSLELHDPCGCVVLRANVAHRVGRDGVDAWVSIDLPRR
ncbi:MAG TPA: hypothetical protein VKU41_17150 [Polyangiaceae bacterium]|nr:hypothetical protein [Polyangiaceae bacterium]